MPLTGIQRFCSSANTSSANTFGLTLVAFDVAISGGIMRAMDER
jgi:hypothetical protein